MPLEYEVVVKLPGREPVQLRYTEFWQAMNARATIMAGMTVRPVLSDPPDRHEAEAEGEET